MGGFRPSQAFARLYLIPHWLYDTPDRSLSLANFLTSLISWVQHGIAREPSRPTPYPSGDDHAAAEGASLQRPHPGYPG